MEVQSKQEARTDAEEYAVRLLTLLLQKKKVDHDIKELKQSFKEDGVAVPVVGKALTTIKNKRKLTDSELFELETVQDWLESNEKISDLIAELTAKL